MQIGKNLFVTSLDYQIIWCQSNKFGMHIIEQKRIFWYKKIFCSSQGKADSTRVGH